MTVVVVSADDVIDSAIGALRRGAYDFVRKPYQPEELLRTVDNALQRKRLERTNAVISARLEQSERLHRYLVDHSPDIIYTVDEQGRFGYVNPTVAAMLGYERRELVGHHYSAIVHEDDQERARFAFGERRTGERASRNVELRLKRKDSGADTQLTVALSATGVYADEPGSRGQRFLGTYGVARDISERKRAEELISFQAYHDQLTHLPNRILFLDRLGVALVSARRNRRWGCCSSTWTASSWSTIRSAMPKATSCSKAWRRGCKRACGAATPWRAWAATSSPSCCRSLRNRRTPLSSPRR
jgi:PAS domain S-box-containing protein